MVEDVWGQQEKSRERKSVGVEQGLAGVFSMLGVDYLLNWKGVITKFCKEIFT